MARNEIEVRDGPDKADLLRAVANPDQHLHVSFHTPTDLLEAHIGAIEELGSDGVTFALRGHLTSGDLRGAAFAGAYDTSSRSGRLLLKRA